jgi:hypothetical protein
VGPTACRKWSLVCELKGSGSQLFPRSRAVWSVASTPWWTGSGALNGQDTMAIPSVAPSSAPTKWFLPSTFTAFLHQRLRCLWVLPGALPWLEIKVGLFLQCQVVGSPKDGRLAHRTSPLWARALSAELKFQGKPMTQLILKWF